MFEQINVPFKLSLLETIIKVKLLPLFCRQLCLHTFHPFLDVVLLSSSPFSGLVNLGELVEICRGGTYLSHSFRALLFNGFHKLVEIAFLDQKELRVETEVRFEINEACNWQVIWFSDKDASKLGDQNLCETDVHIFVLYLFELYEVALLHCESD